MVGVLLVDDVPGERANFEQAFGRDLTVAPSIDQLNEQLRRGLTWDLAFVDFNLSSQTSTGLTALLRLHHRAPGDPDRHLQPVHRERTDAVRRRRPSLVQGLRTDGQDQERSWHPGALSRVDLRAASTRRPCRGSGGSSGLR